MLPLRECPLREQSGLEQQRDELLLRFIDVLMTEMAHEIQVESRVARLFGEVNNTSLEKHPILEPFDLFSSAQTPARFSHRYSNQKE